MATVADRKLWLTDDRSETVEDGDPRAAFLLCSAGDEVSDEDAKRYGVKSKAKSANKEQAPPANKGGVSFSKAR